MPGSSSELRLDLRAVAAGDPREPKSVEENESFGSRLFFFTVLMSVPLLYPLTMEITNLEGFWLLPQIGISAHFLSRQLANKEANFAQFCFGIFAYIWFGLAPFVQVLSSNLPFLTPDVDLTLLPVSCFLACLCLLVTIFILNRDMFLSVSSRAVERQTSLPFTVTLWLSSVVLSALYVASIGLDTLFRARYDRAFTSLAEVGDTATLAILAALGWVPALVAAFNFKKLHTQSGKRIFWWLSLIAAVPALMVTNPVSSARYVAGAVWGSVALALLLRPSRGDFRPLKAAMLAGIIFLFPIANVFRGSGTLYSRASFYSEYSGNPDYDAFMQFINAVQISIENGWGWTNQLLGPFVFWVPRSVWPTKPSDTGIYIAIEKGYSFTNLSSPWLAEGILGLGFLGLAIVSVLLAFILKRIDQALVFTRRGFENPQSIFLALYTLILMRGSLLQSTGTMALFFGISSISTFVSKRRMSGHKSS